MDIREALAWGSSSLQNAGIETASLDSSLLLAEVLNVDKETLIKSYSAWLAEEELGFFQKLIQRRLAGECVAYILGRKEFFGLEFLVNPSVLVPRPDTETLVEAALGELKHTTARTLPALQTGSTDDPLPNDPVNILDLCTGSGAVAISLKNEMPELEVWAADISREALGTAIANAWQLLPGETSIHFVCSDLFEALSGSSDNQPVFSMIVCNPPYVPTKKIDTLSEEVKKEPRIALDGGSDGLDLIRRIVAQAGGFLCTGGALLLEADPDQMADIEILMKQARFGDIRYYNDLSGQKRVIGANLTAS